MTERSRPSPHAAHRARGALRSAIDVGAGATVALLLTALLVVPVAVADAPTDGATQTVRDALSKATAVSRSDKPREQQLEGLRELARELVDTHAMGRRALGATFGEKTAAQQEEFLRLFDELIVRAYLQKLLLFKDPKFRFRPEVPKDETVLVVTDVVTGRDTYEVGYEMRKEQERWLATDIIVEGISLISSYADQFASVLKNRTFDELLDVMRRKVDHFRAPAANPS